ncbi:related to WD40 repeat protein [Cephalotrichum gorgonifer]|uniref:Related to WD40 repeat protein n=1 Tax=Cephalotrichum gorgonifer TaxID=2041049 RepID=A0AAE8MYX1_9PEZI|nr:related to WD40 repeat protein [Cephalotrichum gorgonifer]
MYSLREAASFHAPGTYVLDIANTSLGLLSLTSDHRLSLLRHDLGGVVKSFETGHGIMGVVSDGVVCTAGEAGGVSVWDLRAGSRVASFQGVDAPIISLACDASSHSIAVGTELHDHNASIVIWDVRAAASQKRLYTEVHSDDITELKFHPNDPSILLSGSTDGLVNLCDTRIADEDEVVIQTFNHGASIHHAGFLSNTEVYALSHDERFAVYSGAEEHERGVAIKDFGDVRESLGCQYVAGATTKVDGSGGILGVGSHDQQMFSLVHFAKNGAAWEMDGGNRVNLPGAHGEEIVRGFCFFDEQQVVYTCGEDGKVKAWHPES